MKAEIHVSSHQRYFLKIFASALRNVIFKKHFQRLHEQPTKFAMPLEKVLSNLES